jgi:putrescine aminotransferase
MRGGYHGKTTGALSVTPTPRYQQPFLPLLPATAIRYGDLDELAAALVAAPGRACVVLEPIQAEGGVVIPPPGYLAAVERHCRSHGALLVVDEIQTGLGRCGDWWASTGEIVRPDILLVGKALSGGVMPVAAVVATSAAFAPVGDDPTLHTSTFAGSPLAAAAVIATLRVLTEDDIPGRAKQVGDDLRERLADLLSTVGRDLVREVRGRGLLIGVEMRSPDLVGEFVAELLTRGVLVNHSLNDHAVLRLTPPAVLTPRDVELVLAAFEATAETVARRLR